MALVLKDRVLETTTTTGTGTITLAGAMSGFQSFSAIGDGNTCYYTIVGGSEWEVGVGTYTASGSTLSRDSVLDSSNSGNLVNFSAGTKKVFVTCPAERQALNLPPYTITDGASVDIDPTNGDIQIWTLGDNRTPTATNFENGQSVTLLIDDGAAYAITWTIVDKWFGGAPTLSTDELTGIVLFKAGGVVFGAALSEITA